MLSQSLSVSLLCLQSSQVKSSQAFRTLSRPASHIEESWLRSTSFTSTRNTPREGGLGCCAWPESSFSLTLSLSLSTIKSSISNSLHSRLPHPPSHFDATIKRLNLLSSTSDRLLVKTINYVSFTSPTTCLYTHQTYPWLYPQ